MKKHLLLITLLISVQITFAQNYGVLKGRVLDNDNLPLPGANISLGEENLGTSTDVNGFYTVVKIKEGSYDLTVSYIGYQSVTTKINITAGKTTEQNIKLKPGVQLEEVVIGYQLQGQAKALNQQKSSANITNIVASDQIGKFPDANVGDALKRIPGINVQYDQGEARFGHIRGTEPRLNSVTINGERVPSAEAEIRAVQLDLIPSDMIQTIEVNKTLTPDMDADAIGGSINLVTRSTPSSTRLSATLGSGFNMISSKATMNAALVASTRFAKDKIGIVISGSYFDNPLGSDNIEGEWEQDDDGNAYLSDFQVREYNVQRIRQSYSLGFDYKINDNNKIFINGIYNHRNDYENRYRRRYKDIEYEDGAWTTTIERETKAGTSYNKYARLEDQRTMSSNLSGEHTIRNIKVNWSTSYSKASEERPNERYINYRVKGVEVIPNLSDTRKPSFSIVDPNLADLNSEYKLKEITEEHQYTDEVDMNARLDIEIPMLTGKFENKIKLGGRYRGKDKKRDNSFYEYEPLDEDGFNTNAINSKVNQTNSDFLAGNYQVGSFVSREFLGDQDLNNSSLFDRSLVNEELAGNFNASEDVTAAYIMLTQKFGSCLEAIAGIRIENTSLESQGYSYNADDDELSKTAVATDSYTNILPNLMLKYNLNSSNVLRFAFTNTLARPNYYDLVPYKEVSHEDNEIKIGNPSLMPTTSMNLDLMFESYFKSIGLVSAGAFYKSVSDFIVEIEKRDYDYEGNTWDKFYQSVNAGDANIIGAEIAFQRNMDFLPGALKGLGIYANYTYIHSSVSNFNIEGRDDEDIALPGTPKSNLNASLSYEYKGFNIRVSANMASAFRDSEGIGESEFYDRWYDDVFYLDVNAYYAFGKHWKVFADASNLTNQPLRYYQGTADRTMQAEYYNSRFSIGVKFDMLFNK